MYIMTVSIHGLLEAIFQEIQLLSNYYNINFIMVWVRHIDICTDSYG